MQTENASTSIKPEFIKSESLASECVRPIIRKEYVNPSRNTKHDSPAAPEYSSPITKTEETDYGCLFMETEYVNPIKREYDTDYGSSFMETEYVSPFMKTEYEIPITKTEYGFSFMETEYVSPFIETEHESTIKTDTSSWAPQEPSTNSSYNSSTVSMETVPEPTSSRMNLDSKFCCVPYCSSCASKDKHLTFFKLPENSDNETFPTKRQTWLEKINRNEVQPDHCLWVCENHFQKKQMVYDGVTMHLLDSAIPKVNLGTAKIPLRTYSRKKCISDATTVKPTYLETYSKTVHTTPSKLHTTVNKTAIEVHKTVNKSASKERTPKNKSASKGHTAKKRKASKGYIAKNKRVSKGQKAKKKSASKGNTAKNKSTSKRQTAKNKSAKLNTKERPEPFEKNFNKWNKSLIVYTAKKPQNKPLIKLEPSTTISNAVCSIKEESNTNSLPLDENEDSEFSHSKNRATYGLQVIKNTEHLDKNKDNDLNHPKTEATNGPQVLINNAMPDLYSLCNKITDKTFSSLIKLHLKIKKLKLDNDQEYSEKYKEKILRLYYGSPHAYRVLQNALELPPVSALLDFVPSKADAISNNNMSSLKAKLGILSHNQEYAALCVSMIKIQPNIHYDYELDHAIGLCWEGDTPQSSEVFPAQYAAIAMVRGLISDWHHIVGFHLLASLDYYKGFKIWIDKLILELMNFGFRIKAIVTSSDSFLIKAFASRYVNVKKKPYIIVNHKRILHFFDPPHLMQLLYYEMKDRIVCSDFLSAKWEYISKFYEHDSTRSYRFANRSIDIELNDLYQTKLKSAAQVLSLSTAAGISTLIDLKILDKDAIGTVDFIVKINKIIAQLYPSSLQPGYSHIEDYPFENDTTFISSLKCFERGKEVEINFVNCFRNTLDNVHRFQKKLSAMTRYLNLDPLMEFIDKSLLKNNPAKNPTPRELLDIFKEDLMLAKPFIKDTAIECNSVNIFARNANQVISLLHKGSDEILVNKPIRRKAPTDDYVNLDPEIVDSVIYVATYLINKMTQKYDKSISTRMKTLKSSVHFVNGEGLSGSIVVPDNDFIKFVLNLDKVFAKYCKLAMLADKTWEELMIQMNKFIDTAPIDKRLLDYVIGLFLDLRIYHTIKHNNEAYRIASVFNFNVCIYNYYKTLRNSLP